MEEAAVKTAAPIVTIVLAAGLLVACGQSPASPETLDAATEPQAAASPARGPKLRPSNGFITADQANRPGIDGEAECNAPVVMDFVRTLQRQGSVRFVAGYLTDSIGLTSWSVEIDGNELLSTPPSVTAGPTHSLCYFDGDFLVSRADMDASLPPLTARHLILSAPTEPGSTPTILQAGEHPAGVLAPPPPQDSAAMAARGERTYPQPPEVTVTD